ncbi:hypothetical protein, variant [Aphanomyces invadans]|uniref:STAS domain-containing protein n=1 Tax=Aphanomyces invadans TaxID=157072 RepID=A0A024U129_9STRA|nr:hypothetical protein, variant [Aphanomyces invadans]ETW00146.1 hypothetical protein, variant [Aphanomyces invadans]|eukprot:XP_008871171.1 hypothetical protein, variant [Aphanomyces invadans]
MRSPARSGATPRSSRSPAPSGSTPHSATPKAMGHRGASFRMPSIALADESSDKTSMLGGQLMSGTTTASIVAKLTQNTIYGLINAILAIPTMYGYAAIIFSHPDFATFMPILTKLVMLSSVVHQIMFSLLSSLPFAIGQVQDAGLIFLSAIATSICVKLGPDASLEAKVSTTVVTIGLSTALLGITLVALGKFKLAGLVSYLPMPVVGGYLAYIGLFCLFAGLSLCTGLVVNDFASTVQLATWNNIILCLPGVLGGYLFLVVSQKCDDAFSLPGVIVGVLFAFYVLLFGFGYSMEDARDAGWVGQLTPDANFSDMLSLFSFKDVQWHVMPSQVTTWLGMTFVVAFGSCLDVAAIEMDMGQKLDLNHELTSVGWSNFVSGLLGGYTGSYIFSQTIFTYRSKTNSRVVGLVVILSEFALVVMPTGLLSYVPRFFFAATLIFIAIDLMIEWLVLVYHKVLLREYLVLWLSFIAINVVDLEGGMVIGIGFAIMNFFVGYSQVRQVQRVHKRSAAVRNFVSRTIIAEKRDSIVFLELHGYLFFGTAVHIVNDVKKELRVLVEPSKGLRPYGAVESGDTQVTLEHLDGTPLAPSESTNRLPTRYLVLDFKRVTGMDATAARSCFLILRELCASHRIDVLYANVLPEIQTLLLNNEIADDTSFHRNGDAAVEHCETDIVLNSRSSSFFRPNVTLPLLLNRFVGRPDDSPFFDPLAEYFTKVMVSHDHAFYKISDVSGALYILAAGGVDLYMNKDGSVDHGESASITMLEKVCVGGMFGEVDFFLDQPRHMSARSNHDSTVYCLTREEYMRMKTEQPVLWNELRDLIMRSMALTIGNNNWLAM